MSLSRSMTDAPRKGQRHPLSLPLMMVRSGRQVRVTLTDLSVSGARAIVGFPPGVRETVYIMWDRKPIACRVIWAKGKECGLHFIIPLTEHQHATMTRPASA